MGIFFFFIVNIIVFFLVGRGLLTLLKEEIYKLILVYSG